MSETTTVLLCGVGGQGTILAADVLARTAASSGLQVKISEIHGMSQRGGSVTTVVRFGEKVFSMVTDEGCADRIVSFEAIEALRNLHFLKEGGTLLVNDEIIPSLPVQIGISSIPGDVRPRLKAVGATLIDAGFIARQLGNPKGTNVVLIGALSASLPFDEELWCECIRRRVPPKTVEANLASFEAGRKAAAGEVR